MHKCNEQEGYLALGDRICMGGHTECHQVVVTFEPAMTDLKNMYVLICICECQIRDVRKVLQSRPARVVFHSRIGVSVYLKGL
jgi:hypothetical protein